MSLVFYFSLVTLCIWVSFLLLLSIKPVFCLLLLPSLAPEWWGWGHAFQVLCEASIIFSVDIAFRFTMLNFIGYSSILRSFCTCSSLALSNVCPICLSFASILNWINSSIDPLQNSHQWAPFTARTNHLFLCCFLYLILFCPWCHLCGILISLKTFQEFL